MFSHEFLSGGVFIACLAIALCFVRFHRKTKDRLFIFFGVAFAFLAIERVLLVLIDRTTEYAPYVYVMRLLAHLCIIVAIVDRNRRA